MSDKFISDELSDFRIFDKYNNHVAHDDFLNRPAPAEPDTSLIPPTTGEAASAFAATGPDTSILQSMQRGEYSDASKMDRFVNSTMKATTPSAFLPDMPPEGRMLQPVEANEAFAPKGEDWFDKPISEGLAHTVAKQRLEKLQTDSNIARYENTHSWLENFGMGAATSLLDPLNAGAAFIPGTGAEATAARLGGGVVGRTAGRMVAGATGGAAATLPAMAIHGTLDDNFTLRDAFYELAMGAAGGAVIQGIGEGGLRELGRLAPDKLMTDAAAAGITASQNNAAIKVAAGQVVSGKPVDVVPIVHPPATDLDIKNVRMFLAVTEQTADDETIARAAAIARTGQSIDAALREAQKERPPQTIAQVAEQAKALDETGYFPGMSNDEVLKAKESVDAAATAEPPKPAGKGPEQPATGEAGAQAQAEPAGGVDGPVPDWLKATNEQAVQTAEKLGLTNQIAEMAKAGKTAKEISLALGEKLSDNEVRAVRDSLGIAPAGPMGSIFSGTLPSEKPLLKPTISPDSTKPAFEEVDRILALPEVQQAISHPREIDRTHDVPYLAGSSNEGGVTFIDRRVPTDLSVEGLHEGSVTIDPAGPLNVHEQVEHALMVKGGMPYESAHRIALVEEQMAVEALGAKWSSYQDAMKKLVGDTEHEKAKIPPPDLYLKPYDHSPYHGELAKEEGAAPAEPVKETAPLPQITDPEILAAQQEHIKAQATAAAYEQAAQCLVEAGL